MTNMAVVVGLVGFIIVGSLVVAAFSPVFGSLHNDAVTNGVALNATQNVSYNAGLGVAQGFIGFNQAIIAIVFIVLIIVVILLMFSL